MNYDMELVEKLVEKTGISYTEAKEALDNSNGDLLEAMIWLESKGKIEHGRTTAYSTKADESKQSGSENFKQSARGFGEWVRRVVDKGNANCLEMYKQNERKLSVPVTVFVLLLIIAFWVVVPLMIVALFMGYRFAFSGPDLGKDSVNNTMAKATDIADDIKTEITKNETKN